MFQKLKLLVFLLCIVIGVPGIVLSQTAKASLAQEDVGICNPLRFSSTRTGATLLTAINSTGSSLLPDCSATKILLVPPGGTWTIAADLTIPARMTARIPAGASITINSGQTLTLGGVPDCDVPSECIVNNGTLTFASTIPQKGLSSFISSGCAPTVPVPASLTFAAFACTGTIFVDSRWEVPVTQSAAAVTVPNSATVWLALHRNITDTPSGCGGGNWTRVVGTHYLTCASATRPAQPAGGIIFSQVTVAGAVISTVQNFEAASNGFRTHVFNLTDPILGGVCDGVTDDSPALTRANSLPIGSTVRLPNRRCVIASTVTFTRRINLIGGGAQSHLWLTMGTASDGIVYNAGGTTLIYGPELRNFAILGGANAARNCLVMRYVTVAITSNLHVYCGTGATGYGVWLQDFILQSHFHIIINGAYHGLSNGPANGVKATTTPGNTAGTFNANVFDLDITGPGTAGSTGLWIFSVGGGGGNNDIRGTYQGWGGDGIFVQGGNLAYIHDAHLEGGDVSRSNRLHIQDQTSYKLGPNILVTSGTPDENCLIQTSSNGIIEGIACDVLRLENSPGTRISHTRTNNDIGSHVEDASIHTIWLTPNISTGSVRIESGSFMDGSSIAVNGSAERWTTTTSAPPNIAAGVGGAATWAREGTIVFHGNYSISVNTTPANISGVQILTAAQTARLAGRKVAFTAWVRVPTGQPDITPSIYLDNGAETGGYNIISTKDAWTQVSGTINIAANGTMGVGGRTDAKLLFLSAGASTSYYIDAVSVVPSHAGAPIYYTQNAEEFRRYAASVTIAPGLIGSGATVGTSVTVLGAQTGDICTLGPPAAIDAGLGWSCVVTAVDTVNVRVHNISAGGITPASASWEVIVVRRP